MKENIQRGAILELRIKLEKNLVFIGETHGIDIKNMPIKEMLRTLKDQKIIDIAIYELAQNLLQLGNKAAHDNITGHDRQVAEKLDMRLAEQFIRHGLLFEQQTKKEPTFRELFLGKEGKFEKKDEKKSFGELLTDFEKETSKMLEVTDVPKGDIKRAPVEFEKPDIKKTKNPQKDEEFMKLLQLYGNIDEEKD